MTNVNFPIELNDLLSINKGAYVGALSVKKIVVLMNSGLLTRADVETKKKKITEIKELLLEGELITTQIVIGVREDTFTYRSDSNSLTFDETTKMSIIDGYYRCLASVEAYKVNPNIDFNFSVQVIVGNEGQEDKIRNQMKKMNPKL